MLLDNRDRLVEIFQRDWEQSESKREEHLLRAQRSHMMPAVPVTELLKGPPERPDRARQIVEERWRNDGIDHTLPGWTAIFEKEVRKEGERMRLHET
jgi:hypothetical protein